MGTVQYMARTATSGRFRVVDRLIKQLFPVVMDNGWDFGVGPGVHIPPERGVLLAAELIVPGADRHERLSRRPKAYARAEVPLCLVADPAETMPVVTLFSRPVPVKERDAEERFVYARMLVVCAGEPLELPEPFSLTLDTVAMFR